jgi:ABC-type cobalamin/Fe3+-siderophores transport system ATPase subunit
VEVSGIEAVRIRLRLFFRLRCAGPALLTALVGLTVLVSLVPAATAVAADLILVLEDGHLLEHGTHDELLTADGRYADLYRIQAAAYVTP